MTSHQPGKIACIGDDEEYHRVEDNKIWACRQFNKGKELARDLKNIETDLYFI